MEKTYQVYIPAEFLQAGTNTLRLLAPRPLWCGPGIDRHLWWEWDHLQMETLTRPATEPLHGKRTYMGTTLKHGSDSFKVNDETVAAAPVVLPWLGIAYSGNPIRADYWSDVGSSQPRRREYLLALRDLNMTVVADHLNSKQVTLDAEGNLSARDKSTLSRFFSDFGTLFQWYEVDNEPGLFERSKAVNLAIARYANSIRPPHVKVLAPGWAYWPTKDDPSGWERDPGQRAEVEALSQATNGHSYGLSYRDDQGGSFVENLETYNGVWDGWPKEFVTTETGANDTHADDPAADSRQPHATVFDRVLRAHVAVTDGFMQHASTFGEFSLLDAPQGLSDPTTLVAHPSPKGEDTRLKTFRRIALAYASHGKPLPYRYLNRSALAGKRVYVRAVDTSALPPLLGSGGKSRHLLLSFVNFEETPQTMVVRVTLPAKGVYRGERWAPGDTVTAARVPVTLKASPSADLTVTPGPGDAVQYIVTRQ